MTDNVPASRTDGRAGQGTGQGAGAVGGATAQRIDPAELGAAFPRTHHVLQLEFGDRKDFDDPRKEWRRLFSELLGTFALVLAAAGGGLLHAKGQISLAAAVVAPGLMVMAIILFMGAVSGAHLNPAVSLAFALRGDFPWKRVPGYIVTQLIGATVACLFLRLVFGNVEHLGATLPGPGYKNWQALLMEIVLTALLVSVILGFLRGQRRRSWASSRKISPTENSPRTPATSASRSPRPAARSRSAATAAESPAEVSGRQRAE